MTTDPSLDLLPRDFVRSRSLRSTRALKSVRSLTSVGMTPKKRASGCRTDTIGDGSFVFLAGAELIHLLLEEEGCVANILDFYPTHHLTNYNLDVLVRDGHTLESIDFLDFVHQVALEFALTKH